MNLFFRLSYYYACIISLLPIKTYSQTIIDNNITLQFVDEYILSNQLTFESIIVGGLSSIDYSKNCYYAISDDTVNPRFYELSLNFNENSFLDVEVTNMYLLKNKKNDTFINNQVDPEALRIDPSTNKILWVSEGNINNNISPQFFKTELSTLNSLPIQLPKIITNNSAVEHNGALEALCLDINNNGYWIGMESPLKHDGDTPTYNKNNSPVRITHINKSTSKADLQYAYILDKVAKKPKNLKNKSNNGLVELLTLDATQFLTLERSYTIDEKNVVKLFLTSTEHATDISTLKSLRDSKFTPLKKELLLNFDSILDKLPSKTIDNIEGMCLGPKLANGSQSIIFISDNNFNLYGNQITQLILFSLKQS